MNIYVKFLGNPEIYMDNNKIEIQQSKVKAVLLYILYNEKCTRDEVVSKFWSDFDNERGRSNLRNVLYKIKGDVGFDIIESIGENDLQVNRKYRIKRDIDIFLNMDNEKEVREMKDYVFLDGFSIRDCLEFENWVTGIRFAYERVLVDRFISELNKSIINKNLENIILYSEKVIKIDPYNEEAYRARMLCHLDKGELNEAIIIYKKINKILKEELDTEVDGKTRSLYEQIILLKNSDNKEKEIGVSAQSISIFKLKKEYKGFENNIGFKHCIVSGEFGVGKSSIIKNLLKDIKIEIIPLDIKLKDREIKYLSYVKLVEAIDADKINSAINSIEAGVRTDLMIIRHFENLLRTINEKKVIYLRNVQYMDIESLNIIDRTILRKENKKVFVIMELTDSFLTNEEMRHMFDSLENIRNIEIKPFDKDSTLEYVKFLLKNHYIDTNQIPDLEKIYYNTQGNMMFIKEELDKKLKAIVIDSSDIKGIDKKVEEFLHTLNSKELFLTKVLALSKEGLEFKILQTITNTDSLNLIETLKSLLRRKIIIEIREDSLVKINLKYESLKDKIIDNMPEFEIQQICLETVNVLEKTEENILENYYLLNELYHYFYKMKDKPKSLFYEINKIRYELDYFDEFYPKISPMGRLPKEIKMNKSELFLYLKDLEIRLYELEDYFTKDLYSELKMSLKYLIGRTLIRGGKDKEGLDYITKLVEHAKLQEDKDYLMKGYLEYIFFGLRNSDIELMKEYIEKGLSLEEDEQYRGTLLRLDGVRKLFEECYKEAEASFLESIKIFSKYNLRGIYIAKLAAANSYLGEVYHKTRLYNMSKEYFERAIGLCLDNNLRKPLDVIYQSYGLMLYDNKEYKEAEDILKKSLKIYDFYGNLWNRSIVESCLGLISCENKDYENALIFYRKAEIFSKKYSTKQEVKMLDELKERLNA